MYPVSARSSPNAASARFSISRARADRACRRATRCRERRKGSPADPSSATARSVAPSHVLPSPARRPPSFLSRRRTPAPSSEAWRSPPRRSPRRRQRRPQRRARGRPSLSPAEREQRSSCSRSSRQPLRRGWCQRCQLAPVTSEFRAEASRSPSRSSRAATSRGDGDEGSSRRRTRRGPCLTTRPATASRRPSRMRDSGCVRRVLRPGRCCGILRARRLLAGAHSRTSFSQKSRFTATKRSFSRYRGRRDGLDVQHVARVQRELRGPIVLHERIELVEKFDQRFRSAWALRARGWREPPALCSSSSSCSSSS